MTDKQSDDGLPALDPGAIIGYDAIRYVAGYTEAYVKEYARTAVAADRAARQPEPVGEAVSVVGDDAADTYLQKASMDFLANRHPAALVRALARRCVALASPAPKAAQAEQAEALTKLVRISEDLRLYDEATKQPSELEPVGEDLNYYVAGPYLTGAHAGFHAVAELATGRIVHFFKPGQVAKDEWRSAYAKGFYAAIGWAKRPDLYADIGSPAYVKEMESFRATQPTASGAGERPLLDPDGIERLETELFFRRRRLRETHAHPENIEDPGFFDGFRAAEVYYGITTKEQS